MEERIFLRIQAISDFQASIETYPETVFPFRFAQAHFELANILFQHGLTVDRSMNEVYLVRAIQSYEIASVIFESEGALGRWAECQMYIGSVFAHHAHLDGIQTREHDFNEALQRFEAALQVFKQEGRQEYCSSCERAIAGLNEELGLASDTTLPK